MTNTGQGPPNNLHNLLWMICWPGKLWWSLIAVQLRSSESFTIVKNLFLLAHHHNIKRLIPIVAEKSRRKYLTTLILLVSAQFLGVSFVEHFRFHISFMWLKIMTGVTTNSATSSQTVVRGFVLNRSLSWSLST